MGLTDHASLTAFHHSNARPKDKILWLSKTQKEEPENIEELDNTDLEEFEGLLGGSDGLVKTANEERLKYLQEYSRKRNTASDEDSNPRTLGRLLWDASNNIALKAGQNPSTDPEDLARYLMEGKKYPVIYAVASNPSTPKEALVEAYRSEDRRKNKNLSWHILTNYNCPKELLVDALNDPDPDIRNIVVRHPRMPLEELSRILLQTSQVHGQKEIASRHDLPTSLIDKAVKNRPYDSVTYVLLGHENMAIETLSDILFDKTREWIAPYKMGVTQNPNLTPEIIHEAVVKAEYSEVNNFIMIGEPTYIQRLLRHRHTRPETMVYVLNGMYPREVQSYAASHRLTPTRARLEWHAKIGEDETQENVEFQNNTDLDEFEGLFSSNKFNLKKHSSTFTLLSQVADENASPELLRKIIMDIPKKDKNTYDGTNRLMWDGDVVYQAANHPNCPSEALQYILERRNSGRTACMAALHPNVSGEVLVRLISSSPVSAASTRAMTNPNMPAKVLSYYIKGGGMAELRFQAAKNPSAPVEDLVAILQKNRADPMSRAVSENPSIPPRAKINWLIGTGKLQNEKSLEKGNYDTLPNIDNDDLDTFEGLF